MFGSISYKLDGGKQAQYCVFAVTNDGNIKVEDNKVSTYYDANGNKLAEKKDQYENFVSVYVNNQDKKSSITFEVGGSTKSPYVIRDTRLYNKYNAFRISNTGGDILNYEERDETTGLTVIMIIIYVVIGIVSLIIIVVVACLIKKFACKKKNSFKDGTGEALI
ncbi:hypothetical protein TVAG_283580 [Trichomonas vaginalis G3]|uniref:Uncharacterized protein n=1 Tax=Trichomonas vaginalis (strain ATCC PRA-98 / G3) TaxID=412133 RepID=A2DER2_TRIV3|nr:hypothetical protein TVAG_283580 [Trichomonas vaginalis G3]|eukprot:XP_001582175.1 hypothetical protein [Trichomonas vaginalis G3]